MLDQNVLNNLPDEYKQAARDYQDTFGTPGWTRIKDWALRSAEDAKERVFLAMDWDTAVLWKGKWEAFNEFANLMDSTYQQLELLAELETEDTLEEDSLDYE